MKVFRTVQILALLVVLISPAGLDFDRSDELSTGMFLPLIQGTDPPGPALNVDYTGHIGGMVLAVAVQGGLAYIGEGASLTILDINKVEAPSFVGTTELLPDVVEVVEVAGNYAYVGHYDSSMRVIDVSDPANPRGVGYYNAPIGVQDIAVSANYALIASGEDGLQIVDISQPTNPKLVGYYATTGLAKSVAVAGNYAYVVDYRFSHEPDILHIIDISNPLNPIEVGFYMSPGVVEDVVVLEGIVYVVGYYYGLRVLEVTDPSHPVEISSYENEGFESIAVSGGYAYLVDEDGIWDKLMVIDISNPYAPYEVGSFDIPGFGIDLTAAGDFVYLAIGTEGLLIIGISDPMNLSLAGTYVPCQATDVAVSGDYVYMANPDEGLCVIDIFDPSQPVEVVRFDTPDDVSDLEVSGHYVYISAGEFGVRVLDVSDPANPSEVGFYDTPGYVLDVALAGAYAYVVDYGSLRMLDISDPTHPVEMGVYYHSDSFLSVDASGYFAYGITEEYVEPKEGENIIRLRIIDFSDPANPSEVDSYVGIEHVAVSGNYAFLSGGGDLHVIDVSDPANPIVAGYCSCYAFGNLAVAGMYVYLSGGQLHVIDISDPTRPTSVGYFYTPSSGAITTAGEFVYLSDIFTGMVILKLTDVPDDSYTTIHSDQPDPSIVDGPFQVGVDVYSGFGIPGGDVTVTVEGDTASCITPLDGGVGVCQLVLDESGVYSLTATYSGDKYFLPSASVPITHTVVNPVSPYLPLVGGG